MMKVSAAQHDEKHIEATLYDTGMKFSISDGMIESSLFLDKKDVILFARAILALQEKELKS